MRNYEPLEFDQEEIEQKICNIKAFFKEYGFKNDGYGLGTNLKRNNQEKLFIRINELVEFEIVPHLDVVIEFASETKSSIWWLPEGGQPMMRIINGEHTMDFKLDKIKKIEIGHKHTFYEDDEKIFYMFGFTVFDTALIFG